MKLENLDLPQYELEKVRSLANDIFSKNAPKDVSLEMQPCPGRNCT